jgi:Variant SH3 domain
MKAAAITAINTICTLLQAQQAGAAPVAQQQQQALQPPLPQHSRARSGSFRVAIAKFDYTAHGPEQISFKANDVIKLHSDKVNGKGWGLGEVNGKMGWFPGDFVKIQVLTHCTYYSLLPHSAAHVCG